MAREFHGEEGMWVAERTILMKYMPPPKSKVGAKKDGLT